MGANRHPGWILGRRREWEKVGERERGKEGGREKEEKRMGGKGNGTKKRRGGKKGKEMEEGRKEFCAVVIFLRRNRATILQMQR